MREHFPGQLPACQRRYPQSAFVSAAYRRRIAEIVESACRQYKLSKRFEEMPTAEDSQTAGQRVEVQPRLPFSQ